MSKVLVALLCIAVGVGHAESFDELAGKAASARDANNLPAAAALYRQALVLKPDWAEGWFYLGSLSYDADDYATGQEALSRFVKLDEKTPAAWSLLGLCEFETGSYDASLRHIRQAMQSAPGLPPEMLPALRFHEAELLTHADLYDQAVAKYLVLIRMGTQSPALFNGIGLAALRTPLLTKDIPPDQQQLISTAGLDTYLWMAGQTEPAERAFRELIDHFPSTPNVHCLYGNYLLATHPEGALAEFKKELEVNPKNAEARGVIAEILAQQEDSGTAFTYAEKAAQDGPAVPLAQYIYGVLLARQGDTGRAIPHLETAESLDPDNLEYHLALASSYSKSGRVEDARRERARCLALAKEKD